MLGAGRAGYPPSAPRIQADVVAVDAGNDKRRAGATAQRLSTAISMTIPFAKECTSINQR